ncbi:hypothetical protein D3C87_102840 [compost metagenome]
MLKLSPRLELIYSHLLPGVPVWDFCCDHGYIGLKAYESGLFPEIHLIDRVPHLIAAAQQRFEEHVIEKEEVEIHFHALAGEDLLLKVTGNVIVAGVGALTTLEILEGLLKRGHLCGERLLFVPQKDVEQLEEALMQWDNFMEHYTLEDTVMFREKQRLRKLLIFRRKIAIL